MKCLKWILTTLTVISSVIMLFVLPDIVPVHFDVNGVVDRWGSKYEILILPILAIVSMLAFELFTKWYNKKINDTNYEKEKAEMLSNIKVLNISTVIISFLFCGLNIPLLYTTYMQTYPEKNLPTVDVVNVVIIIMGIIFIVLGNYMPKAKNNPYVGFRCSWTLYNDNTWRKSNRFASYGMMIAGLITLIAGIFVKGIASIIFMMGSLMLVLPVCLVYAYVVYRKEKNLEKTI